MLQAGSQLVDIAGRNARCDAIVEKGNATAADGVTTHLNQQSLHGIRIIFLRGQPHQLAERAPHRHRLTIGTHAGHRIERVGEGDDARRHRHLVHLQAVRVAGSVRALVMPAHHLRNHRPWKLNAADDLVPHGRVIGHRAKFVGIKSAGLAEQVLIDGDLADIVQISCRTQRGYFRGVEAQGFADGGGVARHPQRMPMNVDVLDIDRGRECFQRIVIKTMQ